MRILITGAGSGIGHDSALELAKRGHEVYATTRDEAQKSDLLRDASEQNLKVTARKVDITVETDVAALRDENFDVVICSAAIGESGPLTEIPFERLEKLFATNVLGTMRVVQTVALNMIEKKSGRVILVSSVAGRIVIPYLGMYHMTKFAIEAAGDALRLELAQFNIRVSLIEPGLIGTGFNERMADSKYEWLTARSAYSNDFSKMKAHDSTLTDNSYTTESVVKAIVHAVDAKRPKARYLAPASLRKSIILFELLPAWLRDKIARRIAGV